MRMSAFRPSARGLALLVSAFVYGAATGAASPAAAAETLSPAEVETLREARTGDMLKLAIHESPKAMPRTHFLAEDGTEMRIADLAGRVTVLNLWATWCAPCRYEMPSLDALRGRAEELGIEVVALNIERGGLVKARNFYNKIGIFNLAVLSDEKGAMPPRLGVIGYPVTIILDPQGREIARMQGEADWNGENAIALLQRFTRILTAE